MFSIFRSSPRWLLLIVLPALLLAQWASLTHRLAHGGNLDAPSQLSYFAQLWSEDGNDGKQHSCTLYDASIAADYLNAGTAGVQHAARPHLDTLRFTPSFWQALLRLPFSPRAPPVA